MLDLRPNCETCDKDLPNGGEDAYICTFECTFCANCVDNTHKNVCPNCGGNFSLRPVRSGNALERFPQSKKRVLAEK